MKNKVAELVFRYRSPDIHPQLAAIPGIIDAMTESNGPFIEAKINLRAHLVSIYSGSDNYEPAVSIVPVMRNE